MRGKKGGIIKWPPIMQEQRVTFCLNPLDLSERGRIKKSQKVLMMVSLSMGHNSCSEMLDCLKLVYEVGLMRIPQWRTIIVQCWQDQWIVKLNSTGNISIVEIPVYTENHVIGFQSKTVEFLSVHAQRKFRWSQRMHVHSYMYNFFHHACMQCLHNLHTTS